MRKKGASEVKSRDQLTFDVAEASVQVAGSDRGKEEADRFGASLTERAEDGGEVLNLKPVCPEERSHICHRHPARRSEALLSLLLAEQLLQALVSAPSQAGCEWDDGIWFRGGQYETLDDTPDGRTG